MDYDKCRECDHQGRYVRIMCLECYEKLQAQNEELKDLLRWCWKYRIGHAEFTIPYCIKQQQRIKELIKE